MSATTITTKGTAFDIDFTCSWSSETGATFEAADPFEAEVLAKLYDGIFEWGPLGSFSGMEPEPGNRLDPVGHIVALGWLLEFVESVEQEGPFFEFPQEAIL